MRRFICLSTLALCVLALGCPKPDPSPTPVNPPPVNPPPVNPPPDTGPVTVTPAKWTVMVFMNGDNNLEGDALTDFREMAEVGSSADVKILAQLDRTPGHDPGMGNWTDTRRFLVKKNMTPADPDHVAIGEADMGSAQTLRQFVTWAKQTHPAQRYLLVVWDHGQGYRQRFDRANVLRAAADDAGERRPDRRVRVAYASAAGAQPADGDTDAADPPGDAPAGDAGTTVRLAPGERRPPVAPPDAPARPATGTYRSISNDDTSGTQLYNHDIQTILQGENLDVIGFDACLMAMVETAYAMNKGNVARVMVGSEELEPGSGWQYDDWLGVLAGNPGMDGAALGKVLVEAYQRTYDQPGSEETLSAVDLSKANAVADAVTALAGAMTNKLNAERANIVAARGDCDVYAPFRQLYHIDVVRFCERLAARTNDAQLKQLAGAVKTAVAGSGAAPGGGAVLANFAGEDRKGGRFGSNGLAIYFPATGALYTTDPYEQNGYKKDNTFKPVDFVRDHTWSDFLHAYFAAVP